MGLGELRRLSIRELRIVGEHGESSRDLAFRPFARLPARFVTIPQVSPWRSTGRRGEVIFGDQITTMEETAPCRV